MKRALLTGVDGTRSRLDARNGIPMYIQLRAILQEEINGLAAGDLLPSETEITKHFRVSRSTVRQAFADLEKEGLVERRRGAGTFVSHRRHSGWRIQSERGWHDEMSRSGHVIRTHVLSRELDVPPTWVGNALELDKDAKAIRMDRIRWIDDQVATYVRNYLHPELCAAVLGPEFDGLSSLYAWLETNCGLWVSEGTRTITAVAATEDLAQKLEVPVAAPLLLVDAISSDAKQGPFEVYECWHRADLTSVLVSVLPPDALPEA